MEKSIKKRIADLFEESEDNNNQYDISFTKLLIWLMGVALVSSFTPFVFPGAYTLVKTYAALIILLIITAPPVFRWIVKHKKQS